MSPSKRLKPVQRIALDREQKAARQMGRAHQTLQQEEQKLHQLKQYQQEYLERYQRAARQGMSASQLQEYRAFLAKLDGAIEQQRAAVEERLLAHSTSKQSWRQTHTRSQALDKVADRYRQRERQESERKEQKESDDRGQRTEE